MKYWVFNDEQLDAAMKAWVEAGCPVDHVNGDRMCAAEHYIRAFLMSQQARGHKLRGDDQQP